VLIGVSGIRGGESSAPTLVLVPALALVPVAVLRDGAKIDHASTSSKISATSSGSGVRGGARGTVILSDLRTDGVVEVPGTGGGIAWRRRGKVGSRWGCGPGSSGRGLLIRLRGPLPEAQEGGVGKRESARGRAPEPEGVHGEASDMT
jgi:hypothetical protein